MPWHRGSIPATEDITYAQKGGLSMKQILFNACFSLLIVLLLPSATVSSEKQTQPQDTVLWIEETSSSDAVSSAFEEPAAVQTIQLLTKDGVKEMALDAYLVGVVLSEMPPEFELEALKAQAVAARTFTEKRRQAPKHDGADICADSSCCQAWQSEQVLQEKFGENYDAYRQKSRAAVDATRDEILVYDGAPIDATYFSCSGGMTEDAAAVWGSDVPYLKSVVSYGEETALRYHTPLSFSAQELEEKLGTAFTGTPESWLGELTRTNGDGVDTIELGGTSYQGTELRRLLGLPSTNFTVHAEDDVLVFEVLGYGHRVGMSQYGANYMASQGYDYRVILQYYYRGTEITTTSAHEHTEKEVSGVA